MVQRNQFKEAASQLIQRAGAKIRAWDPRVTIRKNIPWALALLLFIAGWVLCRPRIGLMAAGAICVEASMLALLYGLILCVFKVTHSWPNFRERKPRPIDVGMFALISCFTTFFVLRKVLNDHTVYTWDYINYWSKTIEQGAAYLRDPFRALADMFDSILHDEYNNFICLFTALPVQIFGNSIAVFAATVQILFNLPALWILSTAGKRLLERAHIEIPWWFCYLVASLCPTIFYPSAYAYPDSFTLIFVALMLLLAIDMEWHHPQTARVALLGILMPLCLIARQYFSFFIVNLAVMLPVSLVVTVLQTRKEKVKRTLVRGAVAIFMIFAIATILLLVFFSPLLYRTFSSDFVLIYSAYNRGDFFDKMQVIQNYSGNIVIAISLLGAAIGIAKRRTRGLTLGIVAGTIVSCLFFFQIQYMGVHHQLLVASTFALLMTEAIGTLAYGVAQKRKQLGRVAAGAYVALLLANTIIGWSSIDLPLENLYGAFVTTRAVSEQRDDLDELRALADYLNGLDGHVYLLASSEELNNQTLQFLNFPEEERAVKNQYDVADVDLRDGFPRAFLSSQIVLVPEPLQFHLEPEDQRIIGALAQHFIDHTDYAVHYERLKTFELENDIRVTVYQQFEEWKPEDFERLADEFDGYYPDYPELFSDRIREVELEIFQDRLEELGLTNGTI